MSSNNLKVAFQYIVLFSMTETLSSSWFGGPQRGGGVGECRNVLC